MKLCSLENVTKKKTLIKPPNQKNTKTEEEKISTNELSQTFQNDSLKNSSKNKTKEVHNNLVKKNNEVETVKSILGKTINDCLSIEKDEKIEEKIKTSNSVSAPILP